MSNWPSPGPRHQPLPHQPSPYGETYVYLPPVHRSSTAHLVCAWLAAVLTGGYMLPWAIGATRNRTNCVSTALVNALLGWTLIGWIVALVMACGPEPQQPVIIHTLAPQPYAPQTYAPQPYASQPYAPQTYATLPPQPYVPALPASQPTAAEVTMPLPDTRR